MSRFGTMESKRNAVVVGGGGHVGLPLSIVLANSGIETYAFDISEDVVNMINSGQMPFQEDDAEINLARALELQKLKATTNPECITKSHYIIVVIGTPVDEHLSPNPNSVVSAILELERYLHEGQVILLRSTVFPGVTRKVFEEMRIRFPKIRVAYCPERIIEGQALKEIKTLPQIIGAYDNESFEAAKVLFDQIGVESIHVTPEEAELAKLFTNVWRYIKFASANQFWMMANDLGVDYEEVRRAIAYKYPRAADLPSAGFAAGPCLFKDTMQLSALVQQNFPLGHSAMMINEGTPGYLVRRIKEKYDLRNLTVGILGMAFKGNVDDTRSSLAYKLRKLLMFEAKDVLISDPFTKDVRNTPIEKVLEESDLLIIGAPHTQYKAMKIKKPVIDIWGLRGDGVLV
jgi:UDP-N-acetyl-D-mannosaminuronic acid dehydrogenase